MSKLSIVVATALNTGAAEYANLGDVAMLQVGVRRLQGLWPSARISVLTESPADLAVFCPATYPLSRAGRDLWVGDNAILGSLKRRLPPAVASSISSLGRVLRLRYSGAFRLLMNLKLSMRDHEKIRPQVDAFIEAIDRADLFVVCGAGGFTDSSRTWDASTLSTLEEALHRKVPAVMFGQGMGPLDDLKTLNRAREILPRVNLFTLRGTRGDQELAASLGLGLERIATTGDEAVELAYEARAKERGDAVGINLRMASYSNVKEDTIDKLRPVLHSFARRQNVPLLPVPIAFHAWANDTESIRQLLRGFDDHSDGGINLDTPLRVIEQVGRCRIVVSGAYHAAVFALSQGIPVVGLSASADYTAKFLGLKDQFGAGCELVNLDSPDMSERLAAAMEEIWQSAETVRLPLQEKARQQIDRSRRAYEKVRDIVADRARKSS